MKVVYCLSNVIPFGGKEQVTCVKADALSKVSGYNVWLAFTESPESLPLQGYHPVHLVDLGIRYTDNKLRFPWNLFVVLRKKFKHKKALLSLFHEICPDIVVSTGSEITFLSSLKGHWKVVQEVHSTKKWDGMPTPTFLFGMVYKALNAHEHRIIAQKVDCIVCLTQEQKDFSWPGNDKVVVIPNPIRFISDTPSNLDNKRAIAVGRLAYEKNFPSLIKAWSIVASAHPDWKLDIFGDGGDYSLISSVITKEGLLEQVSLKGTTIDIRKELLSSSIFIMTSRYETFSLALLEALGCGLPIVSYDCPFGPRAVINNGQNGYLVPLDNETALADRICQLISNDGLRQQIGKSAFESSKRYSLERVINEWVSLFESLASRE